MSDKELIDWQLQKTNYEYLNELKNNDFRNLFTEVTYLYDNIWYGDFNVSEIQFKKVEKPFLVLNSKLNGHG